MEEFLTSWCHSNSSDIPSKQRSFKQKKVSVCFAGCNYDSKFIVVNVLTPQEYDRATNSERAFSLSEMENFCVMLKTVFPNTTRYYEEKDCFQIVLKVKDDYASTGHLRCALDFFRILWEHPLIDSYRLWLKLQGKTFKGTDSFFEDIQILSAICDNNTKYRLCHRLPPCVTYRSLWPFVSEKQFLTYVKSKNNNTDPSSTILWDGLVKSSDGMKSGAPLTNKAIGKILEDYNDLVSNPSVYGSIIADIKTEGMSLLAEKNQPKY